MKGVGSRVVQTVIERWWPGIGPGGPPPDVVDLGTHIPRPLGAVGWPPSRPLNGSTGHCEKATGTQRICFHRPADQLRRNSATNRFN
jgi:hypothetical protein